jgi:hypothetical protein
MLPELCEKKLPNAILIEGSPLSKEFSSADTVLSLSGTIELLRKHDLLLESQATRPVEELLR